MVVFPAYDLVRSVVVSQFALSFVLHILHKSLGGVAD